MLCIMLDEISVHIHVYMYNASFCKGTTNKIKLYNLARLAKLKLFSYYNNGMLLPCDILKDIIYPL